MFTVVVTLLAAVVLWYCALIGLWVFSTADSPEAGAGGVFGPVPVLSVIAMLAIGAVLIQLTWANHATEVGATALRSLLVLAGPGVMILVFAVAAAW